VEEVGSFAVEVVGVGSFAVAAEEEVVGSFAVAVEEREAG